MNIYKHIGFSLQFLTLKIQSVNLQSLQTGKPPEGTISDVIYFVVSDVQANQHT